MSKNVSKNWAVKKNVFLKIIHLSLFVCLGFTTCFGQEIASFDFGNKEILKPTSLSEDSFSMTPTPNNNGISTLFDNFRLSLQNEKDALSGTITTGFRVPVKIVEGKPFVYYSQQIRGMISKDENTRIVILIDLAGQSTLIEFPFGKKVELDWFRSFPRRVKATKELYYSANFTIFVERKNAKSVTLISFDSFDLTVRTTAN